MVFLGSIAQQLGEFQFVLNFLSTPLPAFLWRSIPGRLVVLCEQCFKECYNLYLSTYNISFSLGISGFMEIVL